MYDTLGNLIQVTQPNGTVITYTLDGRGRRVGKAVDGVRVRGWLYGDQLRPLAELDGTGAVVSRFVYGTRANVPEYLIKDGTTYRIFADHLGSPRIIVDATTGAIVHRMDFGPFGEVQQNTNPDWQPFGFAGGLYDADTGLVRFGARDYDARTGRWTAKDPIGFESGLNFYAYVGNSPIDRIDPYGDDWVSASTSFIGGFLGGAATTIVTSAALASGTVAGAALAVGAVGVGAYATTIAIQEAVFGFDPYTGATLSTEERIDAAAGLLGALAGGAAATRGAEFELGDYVRVAPFGNRTGHPTGELPHYHRGVADPRSPGNSLKGQGKRRHRPWDRRNSDESFCDRF